MNDVVERVARAIYETRGFGLSNERAWEDAHATLQITYKIRARAAIEEMLDPGAAWDGLPRQIMMWLDIDRPPTPRALFYHLERVGQPIPQWLRDEPEMQSLDHVPSKGTRCVIIYKAMLSAALADASPDIGKEGIGNDVR